VRYRQGVRRHGRDRHSSTNEPFTKAEVERCG
jgi:hypothetical protein